jgi:hypothetical protein
MSRFGFSVALLWIVFGVFGGCADSGDSGDSQGDLDGDDKGTGEEGPKGSQDTEDICVTLEVAVEPLPVRLMILQDRSTSMNDYIASTTHNKWEQAKMAVEAMVSEFESTIEFGLDLFPFGSARCDVRGDEGAVTDTLLNNASRIMDLMDEHGLPETSLSTPLYLAIENFLSSEHAPLFESPTRESYLVVISDGADTCGVTGEDRAPELEADLADVTSRLLNENQIRTFVVGFGDPQFYGEENGIDVDQLNAIAANGGTEHTEYIDAVNGDALRDALRNIASSVEISCAFEIGEHDSKEVDLDLVNVYFDKTINEETGEVEGAVGRDDDCKAGIGWTWLDEARTMIQFCDKACETLKSREVDEVSIEITCEPQWVFVV